MQSEITQIICGEIEVLIFERTRDQFGRAWVQPAPFTMAVDVTNAIERKIAEHLAKNPLKELPEQVIQAKLQRAWWDSVKLVKQTKDDHDGFRLFCRAMHAALQRRLF